jgi:D-sedoheptulose 7-phosphate isomerase
MTLASGERLAARVHECLRERTTAGERFFAAEAESIARLCHRMAERFARGGRLLALGSSPQARSDARHVAVEFVHPVIVGKRALPAVALVPDGGPVGSQMELVAEPADMVMAFDADTSDAVAVAASRGCLVVSFAPIGGEWEFDPGVDDPFVRQELVETTYHVVWELVHVFFEHRGLLADRDEGSRHDAGQSSFLYPFLAEQEDNLDRVLDDVRASVLLKADEVGALRARTLKDGLDELIAAAADVRASLDAGGTLFAFGNGGSATDAMDLVADLRAAPQGWPARRAVDLTDDAGILTALANDIGPEVLFARQLIAHGRRGDVAVALSTSGSSANILEALAEARRRGLATVAFVGYDGGRVASERLADHVVVSPSEHIPRIQEAQASGYHVLRELVELGGVSS